MSNRGASQVREVENNICILFVLSGFHNDKQGIRISPRRRSPRSY
nr:MAG TPA: hypothetical protein [Caudoviricetes sp.]